MPAGQPWPDALIRTADIDKTVRRRRAAAAIARQGDPQGERAARIIRPGELIKSISCGYFMRMYYAILAYSIDPSFAISNPNSGRGFGFALRAEKPRPQVFDSVAPCFPAKKSWGYVWGYLAFFTLHTPTADTPNVTDEHGDGCTSSLSHLLPSRSI
jgi:hypothetical protein